MAIIRRLVTAAFILLCKQSGAQTIYYPAGASQLLKATAEDMSLLLRQATGTAVTTGSYQSLPQTGIVLAYDSSISHNLSCRIKGNGSNELRFSAREDNGLIYGIYHYLRQLGFRFYQPGTLWQQVPVLTSAFTTINTTITGPLKYNTWFISGGYSRWAMDTNNQYGWDTYPGETGHGWALFQRRNGFTGAYRFAGHRTDVLTSGYLDTLRKNPCYTACNDGSRQADTRSVPDIHSTAAMQSWAGIISKKHTQYRTAVYGNPALYANLYRNFSFNSGIVGIEVPDGARWGNSSDASCPVNAYPSESDQQFILAQTTAAVLGQSYPNTQMQCYAYSTHADVPSATIAIPARLDVQVIPTAFQMESSTKGLLNRWYNRHPAVSEYHYMNIPQWGGETPVQHWSDVQQTIRRIKEKSGQGLVWEASPAKFASIPYLLAANNQVQQYPGADSSLLSFCNAMFGPAAAPVHSLLQCWGDDRMITQGDFMADNQYKMTHYLRLVSDAAQAANGTSTAVQQRIAELKAYVHYMVLYYNWQGDQRSNELKKGKAAALCLYLARCTKLQLVNSYFIIADIVSRFAPGSTFATQFNPQTGTAYQGGNLAQLSASEIEANFLADKNAFEGKVNQYRFQTAAEIKAAMPGSNINPAEKINFKTQYTNGYQYPGRSELYIFADKPSPIRIQYTPRFDMSAKGTINFTVEDADKALLVLTDITLQHGAAAGTIDVNLPAAGKYKLTITTKNKAAADVSIVTNGNLCYKATAFLGTNTEQYRNDLLSMPGYFYVPQGTDRVYFSINNSNPGGTGFATPDAINKAFVFRDHNNNVVNAVLAAATDSGFFYLSIPTGAAGSFWQVVKNEQYRLCFANISNLLWYGSRKPCTGAAFSVAFKKENGNCITTVTAAANTTNPKWEIYDLGKWHYYSTPVVELPEYISPNAIITLKTGSNCSKTRRLGNDENYQRNRESCASGSGLPVPAAVQQPGWYPNPSANGIFQCRTANTSLVFDELQLTNSAGVPVAQFKKDNRINITHLATGIYLCRYTIEGKTYHAKLIKL